MSVHSPVGASSYHRWKACPGSVKLSEGVKQQESSYAKEGTEAHDIAAGLLEYKLFNKRKPNIPVGAPPDMMEAVYTYVDYVLKQASALECRKKDKHILIEHRFHLTEIHDKLFGTADAVLYGPKLKKLKVIDYKHGQGIIVEVDNNLQLQYYALGALMTTGFPVETVEVTIVQPRASHADGVIRNWEFDAVEILDFAGQLRQDVLATEKPEAPLVIGEHCRFCPAAPTKCPKIREKSLAIAKQEFSPTVQYDPEQLKDVLDKIPAVEAYCKKVREFAYKEAEQGRVPPGYKMVAKRATRKWKDDDSTTANALEQLMPRKDFHERKLKSPAKIDKMIPKDFKDRFNKLVVKESSGKKLVAEKDPGEAILTGPAVEFTKIKGE